MELAALESVPNDLVDNAAILGGLSLVTAALFLIDLAGPKGKQEKEIVHVKHPKTDIQLIESQIEPKLVKTIQTDVTKTANTETNNNFTNGIGKTYPGQNGVSKDQNGYKKMKDKPKKFDIYGKDIESDTDEDIKEVEEHSPVWSKIREGSSW